VLVELSVMEQRYQAVLAVVQDGWKVVEVARRLGVSRQSVHTWITRYERGGLGALADRSHRPQSCPHQVPRETEAVICELGRRRPAWGPGGSATSSRGPALILSRPGLPSTGVCAVTA
jgi:transposase